MINEYFEIEKNRTFDHVPTIQEVMMFVKQVEGYTSLNWVDYPYKGIFFIFKKGKKWGHILCDLTRDDFEENLSHKLKSSNPYNVHEYIVSESLYHLLNDITIFASKELFLQQLKGEVTDGNIQQNIDYVFGPDVGTTITNWAIDHVELDY